MCRCGVNLICKHEKQKGSHLFECILFRWRTAVCSSSPVNHTAACGQDVTDIPWHDTSKCQKNLKHKGFFLTKNVTRSCYFEMSQSFGKKKSNFQSNFFLTWGPIITKLGSSMKVTIFSSDYCTPPTQTMQNYQGKKRNPHIIHTLNYISENRIKTK